MARRKEKQAEYQKKYMRAHRMLSVLLDTENDKDIILWLGEQENRSEAVRRALQKEAKMPMCKKCKNWHRLDIEKMTGECRLDGKKMNAENGISCKLYEEARNAK